jgi:4-amino-4-deoxy-L-arabinose transferase-like glycosyltransferase
MPSEPAWAQPRNVGLIIGAYLIVHFAVRLWMGPTLGLDDAEQALFAQHWLLNYRFRAPPLFTWVLTGASSVINPGVLVISVIRYALLAMFAAFTYLTARRLIRDPRLAALAAFSFTAVYVFGYYSHHDLTHTTVLSTFLAAAWYAFVRLAERPTLGWYLALGLSFGLGMLGKWNFVIFALALTLASLVHPAYRPLVLTWKIVPAALVTAAIVVPSALWALHVGPAPGDSIGSLLGRDEQRFFHALMRGTLGLAKAVLLYPQPFLVMFLVAFGAAAWRGSRVQSALTGRSWIERQQAGVPSPLVGEGQGGGDSRTINVGVPPTPNPSPQGGGGGGPRRDSTSRHALVEGPVLDTPFVGLTIALAVGLHWLLVPLAGATSFDERLMQPALLILPIYLFMLVERGIEPRAIRRYAIAVIAVAAIALGVRVGIHAAGADYCRGACRAFAPFEELAAGLRKAGFAGTGTIVVPDFHIGGNLRVQFPHARIVEIGYPARAWPKPAGQGQCLAVWVGGGEASQRMHGQIDRYLAHELRVPADAARREGTVTAPMLGSTARTYQLAHTLYDAPQGDCR